MRNGNLNLKQKDEEYLKTKFFLIIASVILVVSLIVNSYFCWQQGTFREHNGLQNQVASLQSQVANLSSQTNSFQNEIASLQSQEANLESQVANLRNQTNSLQSENSHLNDEKANLQSQLSQLSQGEVPPKLVTRLGASDMRYNYSGQDIRLYITGEVWNVGTEAAHNCSLHVTLYQGVAVANDTYVELGTLDAGAYVDIATIIYYTGVALTNWTITPEFD